MPRHIVDLLVVLSLMLPLSLTAQQQRDEPVYEPGAGVTTPTLIKDVKPQYTANALRKKLIGRIELKAVVTKDGVPTQIEVTKHLDEEMEAECVRALEQWRFKPGTKDGEPVAVRITVELTFTTNIPQQPEPVYEAGAGVTLPKVISEVKPYYTPDAMTDGVQGEVTLECVVSKAGVPTNIRVTKTLDDRLDRQAIAALEQWRFEPGQKDGAAVAVRIAVEMRFTLK